MISTVTSSEGASNYNISEYFSFCIILSYINIFAILYYLLVLSFIDYLSNCCNLSAILIELGYLLRVVEEQFYERKG